MEQLAAVGGPVLVRGRPGSSSPPYQPSASRASAGVVLGDRLPRELLEAHRVDRDLGAGEQPHDVVAEHDGVVAAGRPAGEVGGLVQAGRRTLRRLVRPEQVHHLLAVEAVAGGEGEDLDERRGAAA